ncbi:nickel pincer cofactor biosynthesis protein LarB [Veillonella criceti]|uniref:Phosphoribosylaminoimidazole carboxylase, catalytic subunit n=1 Tax=Veillonella criceti TaxID=103891 RepID=A0A380NJ25_9FIRM|nr:nickel pincer cofactor biosynthesis protein LarB [Veillonella criceti]SUP40947.1 phosphoribosylaminoimidazole carboxylase, catalytic subunit [Veillonella criceti]
MNKSVSELLEAYKAGHISLAACEQAINDIVSHEIRDERTVSTLQEAVIDLDRAKRQGFPEVVYCEGKTDEQCITIFKELNLHYGTYMGTRGRQSIYEALLPFIPDLQYDATSRILYRRSDWSLQNEDRSIAVVTAGTSDIPIAEEAALTAELMGNEVKRIYDVGVAGIHRLFHRLSDIQAANVVIVVAGMEGALASVVGGLVTKPIIAVPTSVGYGANFKGLAALLSMLNSCAAGVGVVNIDNGFGAGRLAHVINSQR